MKKSTLLSIVALLLALMIGVSGTMAYLQDSDADKNTMTLGNVKITQNEQERDNDGKLVPFTQDKPLYPAVGKPAWNLTDESTQADKAWRQFAGMENVVDKYVTVTNTGKSDAYVRTLVALEMGALSYEELGNVLGLSANDVNGDEFKFPGAWDCVEDAVFAIGGKNYNVMVFEHQDAVKPGETTIPSLLQLYLKGETTTNDTLEKIDGNGNGKYDVLVLSQAVQTQGFADANTALTTAFGKINAENVDKWFANLVVGTPGDKWVNNNPPSFVPENAKTVATADELVQAIAAGGEFYLTADIAMNDAPMTIAANTTINMNGKTITTKSTSSTTSFGIEVKTGAQLELKGDGLITFTATKPDTEWGGEGQPAFPGYANNTIKNSGKLIIDGPTVENKTAAGGASYAIDCYQGSDLIIKSGKILGYDKCAIRMFCNSVTEYTGVTVNGGDISGKRGIWLQLPSGNSEHKQMASLTVTGGTITSLQPDVDCAIYSYSYGASFANTNVNISGGTFNGDVAFGGGYKGDTENVTVTGGTFNGSLGRYVDATPDWVDIAKP